MALTAVILVATSSSRENVEAAQWTEFVDPERVALAQALMRGNSALRWVPDLSDRLCLTLCCAELLSPQSFKRLLLLLLFPQLADQVQELLSLPRRLLLEVMGQAPDQLLQL